MVDQEQVDLSTVKQGQQRTWSEGDFSVIATAQQIVGESLCETVDVFPGDRVLDVACGSGNTAIAAARRFAEVTGVDYVPALLDRTLERAAAERLEIKLVEGDAEALPFGDGVFDCVLSTFGAMLAPDQERAAAELLRVCRPGGRVGGELDAAELRRQDVPDDGLAPHVRWAAARSKAPAAVGNRGAAAGAVRGRDHRSRGGASRVRVPLSLPRSLGRSSFARASAPPRWRSSRSGTRPTRSPRSCSGSRARSTGVGSAP